MSKLIDIFKILEYGFLAFVFLVTWIDDPKWQAFMEKSIGFSLFIIFVLAVSIIDHVSKISTRHLSQKIIEYDEKLVQLETARIAVEKERKELEKEHLNEVKKLNLEVLNSAKRFNKITNSWVEVKDYIAKSMLYFNKEIRRVDGRVDEGEIEQRKTKKRK